MKNSTKCILFLFLLLSHSLFAQDSSKVISDKSFSPPSDSTILSQNTSNTQFLSSPTIGFGVGLFSFFGDLYNKHLQSPTVSRIAFEVCVSQLISENFQLNLNALSGKLGANERLANNNRNINFESQIFAGSINMQYNFGHFLPKSRTATPYISLGVEAFEFNSKTDAFDQFGNKYFYWADGTVRNLDEADVNANTAVEIKRDYTYESDIRDMDLDKFGKYGKYSFAIPVGIGASFKINDYFDFKLGTTMHFSFTDYIDGITFTSKGNRQGNNKYDNFMMTSCSIHYNFGTNKNAKSANDQDRYSNIDFLALDLDDYDKDGVADPLDSCQGTPPGVTVDGKGCPFDDDADNYANYRDNELNSPPNVFVNIKGVQLSDAQIEDQYNRYIDSTMVYALIENRTHANNNSYNDPNQKTYSVELGTFKKGLPADLMTQFLSVRDIASHNFEDSTTTYTAGTFNNLMDVNFRKQQLLADGLTNLKIVYFQNGKFYDLANYSNAGNNTASIDTSSNINNKELSTPVTAKTVDTSVIETNKQITQPVIAKTLADTTVAETNKQISQPVETKIKVDTLVADKNIPSVQPINPKPIAEKSPAVKTKTTKSAPKAPVFDNNVKNTLNVPGVVLRVQLGAYKKQISKNVFKGIPNLIELKTNDGLYKYMSGSFNSFNDAAKHKQDMVLEGYTGAFIAAYKDGKRITLKEAGATLVKKEEVLVNSDNAPISGVNKALVKFKVQVGIFKNQPPDDKLAIYTKLTEVTGEKTASGLTRYVVGSFNSYKDAEAYKNEIIKTHGLTDPFVVALFNNEYISIQEAIELLK